MGVLQSQNFSLVTIMVYTSILTNKKAAFALLIDPDKGIDDIPNLAIKAQNCGVDIIMVGGSLVRNSIDVAIQRVKNSCSLPVVLFPGSAFQFSSYADTILLLSLISGRNAEYLIGNHVIAAQAIKSSGMEVIPTGYMLIDSGKTTSVQYMSNTVPIPRAKSDIVVATALAGQQLGLKLIYLEAGSGASIPIPGSLVKTVCNNVDIPLAVGGGIKTPEQVSEICNAGASLIVVGNAIENDDSLLKEMVLAAK